MSFDLWFCNQSEECHLQPDEVADRLLAAEEVAGLVPLDVGAIMARFTHEFAGIEQITSDSSSEPTQPDWHSAEAGGSFLVDWSKLFFCVRSYGATSDELNRVIDLALELGCALYDPQTGVRYEGLFDLPD
jgi:hypothetical protein